MKVLSVNNFVYKLLRLNTQKYMYNEHIERLIEILQSNGFSYPKGKKQEVKDKFREVFTSL